MRGPQEKPHDGKAAPGASVPASSGGEDLSLLAVPDRSPQGERPDEARTLGDRVRDREAVALSGNSGEITTGPHLHFELWHNGLAQDPIYYVIGI